MKRKIMLLSLLLTTSISFANTVKDEKDFAIKTYLDPNSTIDFLTKSIVVFEKYADKDPNMLYYYGLANYEMKKSYLKLNENKGLQLIEKAAVLGDPDANYKYGNLLLKTQNKKGVDFLYTAVKGNQKDAQYKLGKMYYLGNFVDKDKNKGFKLISIAAKNNQKFAQYDLAKILFSQNNENTQKLGIKWLEASVANKNYKSCDDLYKLYYSGMLVKKNINKHITYLKCSAYNNKNLDAQNILASYLENGKYINKDLKESNRLYENLAEHDYGNSANKYAKYIMTTKSSDKDLNNAISNLKRIAKSNIEASMTLGNIYSNGYRKIAKDKASAINYYQYAQELGEEEAQNRIIQLLK